MNDTAIPGSGAGPDSAADVILATLAAHGVDYLFCNPGTDFPPMIEALARSRARGTAAPRPMVVPHENAAVAMAHGVYMVSGRPQAVMVHVNVGTANTINALIDAQRERVPVMLMAGRTPLTEKGLLGSRNGQIHWAQEMFDQAGMLREVVKWDYELRLPLQAAGVIQRAMEVMMSSPRGPAYLSLPREVLGGGVPASNEPVTARAVPTTPYPDPHAVERLAQWIADAQRPLIITGSAGRTPQGMAALASLAERFALPVVSWFPRYVNLPWSHPMHLGFQTHPLLSEADLVLAIDSDAPWFPDRESPPAGCKVVHVGEDPAFARIPIRGFPCDLAITGETVVLLDALTQALAARRADARPDLPARRQKLAEMRTAMRARWKAEGDKAAQDSVIRPEFISRCVAEAAGEDAIIVNEYPLRAPHAPREKPGTFFGVSPAGGLGWGLPAAIGAKLAAPDKLVVATLGDGAYVFANPTACHWTMQVQNLPVLAVVFNNQLYGAVRSATLGMYGKGTAAQDGARLLADLRPGTAFEKLVEANGGYGERVEKPADLPAALARAKDAVLREKRQALLNVVCEY